MRKKTPIPSVSIDDALLSTVERERSCDHAAKGKEALDRPLSDPQITAQKLDVQTE
jgi:hypothetical protein